MLREYVTNLLTERFPEPMQFASRLIRDHTLCTFLETPALQEELLQQWLPHATLLHPTTFDLPESSTPFSHHYYLGKFLTALRRSIQYNQPLQLARIHSMLIDISDKQRAQLRIFLGDYTGYLQWRQHFSREQYQIAFVHLIH